MTPSETGQAPEDGHGRLPCLRSRVSSPDSRDRKGRGGRERWGRGGEEREPFCRREFRFCHVKKFWRAVEP